MVAAYTARGASGFGAAVAMPLLGLVVPLKILLPAWTLVGIAAGVALIGEDRKHVSWQEVARQRRALLALDERVLKDIGITRADAEREASRPFWDLGQERERDWR